MFEHIKKAEDNILKSHVFGCQQLPTQSRLGFICIRTRLHVSSPHPHRNGWKPFTFILMGRGPVRAQPESGLVECFESEDD